MKAGDVALAVIPQSDGVPKRRPVLVLKRIPPFEDILVCGISSKLGQAVPDLDDVVLPDAPDFVLSGLLQPSLIRLGWLETMSIARFKGVIGHISDDRLQRLKKQLSAFLQT